jgi:DNA-binding response OmpR family regulator
VFQLFRRRHRPLLWISLDRDPVIEESPFLQQEQIRLLCAEPGQAALELARKEQPRLIIEQATDRPEADAEFRRGLASRSSTRSIPLILISSAEEDQDASANGADAVVSSPVDPAELYAAVQAFLPLPSRRTPRVDANLRFRYRSDGAFFQAFSRDLSERGVFLHTDREFALGVSLELEFRIPGCEAWVRCGGVVRNITGGVGIEFGDLGAEDQRRLSQFIATHRAGLSY